MISKLEFFIAFRYLLSKKNEKFISITSWFSFIGIVLGVATLIIVMSVMNGFRDELVGKILGMNDHMTIYGSSKGVADYQELSKKIMLRTNTNVMSAYPIIYSQAILSDRSTNKPVVVSGISTANLRNKEIVSDNILTGKINDDFKGIIIGSALAKRLNLTVGDQVNLISPKANSTVIGIIPRFKTYRVDALFKTGMYEYDVNHTFISLPNAQKMFGYQKKYVSNIVIKLSDHNLVEKIKEQLSSVIPSGYYINDWKSSNSELISALEIEKTVMFLILSLIILVAMFNVVSSMIMLVNDKKTSIAILMTMGLHNYQIVKIFFICSIAIGIIGTLFGTMIGLGFAYNIGAIQAFLEQKMNLQLFNPVVYFLSKIPAKIELAQIGKIITLSMLLSILSTIYPSLRATKSNPADILRRN